MKQNSESVIVIGGAGFIGSHLIESLLKRGNFVVCIDNLMRGRKENIHEFQSNSSFVFYEMDANNEEKLKDLFIEHKISYVYHLAANSDIQASALEPEIEFDNTCKTTWSILKVMRETGVKKMFFASTSAVYGELGNQTSFSENHSILKPVSYYGSAKLASEAFISSYSYMNDFDVLVFRFPNVIGPKLTHGVFFDFIKRLKIDSSKLEVLGDGSQSKPYMHVDDLIRAILLLDSKTKGVEIYNIGVDSYTDVKTIAEMVVKEMGLDGIPIIYGNEKCGWKGDVPHFSYNLDRIHKTGWKASMTSNEASCATIKSVLEDQK